MRRWIFTILAVVVFLVIAAVLARWLTADNAERTKVEDLLRAQIAGDAGAMVRQIDGCDAKPACRTSTAALAQRLRSTGPLQIVFYESGTAHALTPKSAPTRVVWKTPSRLTTVQCVAIRRTGNVLSGPSVTVTAISEPIGRQAGC